MKKAWHWFTAKVREWFALDYRSLALLRIGIGLTILFDLIQRSEDLKVFYSDQGLLSRSDLLRLWTNPTWISLHMASGATSFEALLFIIAGIFAIMLIVGYRTTFAIIMSWFMLNSLQIRNPAILQGGDVVFRVVVFWMMFLPLGRTWSLDRLFNRVPAPTQKTVVSAATIGYIIQICALYVFTGLLKTGAPWHNGTAVYYALNVDQLVTPVGVFLREFPHVMSVLTYTVWYIETFGVILFFSPIATGAFRTLGVLMFAGLQIGFNSSMRLGLFGMIAICVTLGLLPSEFWEKGFDRFCAWLQSKGKTGLSIYYDFDCTFCSKVSLLLKRMLFLDSGTRVLPATSDPVIEQIMLEKNSWVVVDSDGANHTSWDGVVTVFSYSPLFFWLRPILAWKPVRILGEKMYKLIAEKRRQVCLPEPVEPPLTPARRTGNIIITVVLSLLILYVIGWNIDTLGYNTKIITPQIEWIGYMTHLDQKWNMFAPSPLVDDGWYVFPGTLRDGTSVDVFDGASPVSYAQPKWIAYTYKNQRWQKYMMNLWSKDYTDYRLGYGQYLCREWNASHPYNKQLMTFTMVFMLKSTPVPGAPEGPIKPTTIWTHHCF